MTQLVLYAEDEPNDALFMRRAVRRVSPDLDLRVVEHGRAAIDYLEGRPPYADRATHPWPDVLLLDLNMPMLTGFEVLRWVRSRADLSRLPVVMFSSSGHQEDRRLAVALGASTYLVKPSSGNQYDAVARELLRWTTDVLPFQNDGI